MRLLKLRRRLVAVTLVCASCLLLSLQIVQMMFDSPRIQFDTPGHRSYVRAEEGFLGLPGQITSVPSAVEKGRPFQVDKTLSRPTHTPTTSLWPVSSDSGDRILEQMKYRLDRSTEVKPKVIYTMNPSLYSTSRFKQDDCAVPDCTFVHGPGRMASADVVVFTGPMETPLAILDRPDQIWMEFMLEAPPNRKMFPPPDKHINWTATYRTDSTIVAPYERFVQFANVTKLPEKPARNYAIGKTKMASWFVSNCDTTNGRLKYVNELQKYIQVDIFGSCGHLKCARSDAASCYKLLNKDYKFYLSFENANCKDYITEKLYWNALE